MNEPLSPSSKDGNLNLGRQALDEIMIELGLRNADVVAASTQPLTHKMVQRGRKGRKLTFKIQDRIAVALSAATGRTFTINQLFNYRGHA